MLALKAAVEAVCASEQGKGFSVIATEIRPLADRSKLGAQESAIGISQTKVTTENLNNAAFKLQAVV